MHVLSANQGFIITAKFVICKSGTWFLIGGSLMGSADLNNAVREVILRK